MKVQQQIVADMDADALDVLHKRLKKTRRRFYTFSLNGRVHVLTRSESIALVVTEKEKRA